MKSPFTGKEMKLVKENRQMEFRKEKFNIIFHFYLCEDTNEQFTDIHLDELNINQLYNKYRDLYNIPFQDEIISIRKKYNLSSGEILSLSNAKLIQMADDPNDFIKLLHMCDKIELDEKNKIIEDIKHLINKEEDYFEFGFIMKKNIINFIRWINYERSRPYLSLLDIIVALNIPYMTIVLIIGIYWPIQAIL